MDISLFAWLVILGLGFPFSGVVLGEAATHLERRQHPLARGLRYIRNYLLPSLAIWLVMQQLLQISVGGLSQVVETSTWLALALVSIAMVNGLLTTQSEPRDWQIHVPNVFFQVIRGGVILSISYYVITGVWQIDLTGLITALGVGSLVIALALQDTLSNLVSGLLLIFARPFKMGDYIEFGDIAGRVTDQNWWSVTIFSYSKWAHVIVPNGALAKATISNYGEGPIWKGVPVSFSYDDPPNDVMPVLDSLVEGIENIETPGYSLPTEYGDTSIKYILWFKIRPQNSYDVLSQLLPRIYYAAKRNNFATPYPVEINYNLDIKEGIPTSTPKTQPQLQNLIASLIQKSPCFADLESTDLEQVAQQSGLLTYGNGELIVQENRPDEGIYLLVKGQVRVFVTHVQGHPQEMSQLHPGDTFGETALFPGEVSLVTVMAQGDVEVIVIPDELIVKLIQNKPSFATDMIQLIESGKRRARQAKGILEQPQTNLRDRQII